MTVKAATGAKGRKTMRAGTAHCTRQDLRRTGRQGATPDMLKTFASTARQRIRLENGGDRRAHLRALAHGSSRPADSRGTGAGRCREWFEASSRNTRLREQDLRRQR